MGLTTYEDPTIDKVINTLRVCEQYLASVLDDLDADARTVEEFGRIAKRNQNRRPVLARFEDIRTPLRIRPRSISKSGIGFLVGKFVQAGTGCEIELPAPDEAASVRVRGIVVCCRQVHGRIHEIGVEFDTEIEPAWFAA